MQLARLSVNINKIACLRNARGKDMPNLARFAKLILQTSAHGITLHPRPDERHIRYQDIFDIYKIIKQYPNKEYNIESYPSEQIFSVLQKIQAHQCTLVPDAATALTSDAGWDFVKHFDLLKKRVQDLKTLGIRSSLFLDPASMNAQQWQALHDIQPNRIELYTGPYAFHYASKQQKDILSLYKETALHAIQLGIQVNAGHDLNQKNILILLKNIPKIKEVSIGQALVSEALELGLQLTIKNYLDLIKQAYNK